MKKIKTQKISKLEKWLSKKLSINHKKAKLLLVLMSITMISSSFVLMTLALQNYDIIKTSNAESFEERIQNTKALNFSYEQN
jgi:hypothetical protein